MTAACGIGVSSKLLVPQLASPASFWVNICVPERAGPDVGAEARPLPSPHRTANSEAFYIITRRPLSWRRAAANPDPSPNPKPNSNQAATELAAADDWIAAESITPPRGSWEFERQLRETQAKAKAKARNQSSNSTPTPTVPLSLTLPGESQGQGK